MKSTCMKCGAPLSEHARSVGKCPNCAKKKADKVNFNAKATPAKPATA